MEGAEGAGLLSLARGRRTTPLARSMVHTSRSTSASKPPRERAPWLAWASGRGEEWGLGLGLGVGEGGVGVRVRAWVGVGGSGWVREPRLASTRSLPALPGRSRRSPVVLRLRKRRVRRSVASSTIETYLKEAIRRPSGGHRESSGGHQEAIGSHRAVIRRPSGGHQAADGRSSGGRREVIRRSSEGHQDAIRWRSGGNQVAISHQMAIRWRSDGNQMAIG